MTATHVDLLPALLDDLGDWLGPRGPGSLESALQTLLRAFAAKGAGLAYPGRQPESLGPHVWADAPAVSYPWSNWPAVEGRLHETRRTAALDDESGSWLLAAAPGVVLWVFDREPRSWGEAEAAALRLGLQALARAGVLPGGDPVRERLWLDQAAHVTSRLSHEFGNVLTGIMGFTELTKTQVAPGTRAREYLDEVWGAARTGADWLKKLNLFCRRSTPQFEPTRADVVLGEEAARARAHWGAAVALETSLAPGLPEVACEAASLREAVAQLLANAHEAVAGPGTVSLTARALGLGEADCAALLGDPRPGRFVEIAVADSGPGLSDETRARVFADLFFSTKPRQRGMGLPVVYGIARRFGGGLHLGAGPERGTVARLYLPALPPQPAADGNGGLKQAQRARKGA